MKLTRNLCTLIASILFIVSFSLISTAQDYRNVLSLHTGKSYILDFPVKVTRVVGGDPSAMELNLFKKDTTAGEAPGYQLLVAPIAEKSTNIIVWTDIGLYVFDVIIDNTSPYTAQTIVTVPKEKKFTIPLVESSTQPKNQTDVPKGSKVDISNSTGDVFENKPAENNEQRDLDAPYEVDSANGNPDNTEVEGNNQVNNDTSDNEKFSLDVPPSPDDEKKEKKKNKSQKVKPVKETVVSKPVAPPEEDMKIKLKPPIDINNQVTRNSPAQETDKLRITLRPQSTNSLDLKNSTDTRAVTLNSNRVLSTNNGLKLEIKGVNRVDNSLIIHLVIQNLSTECKYLFWESTKVTDSTGKKLYVRNQSLPPGIIYPRQEIRGDLIAYPKTTTQILPSQGRLNVALFGTQGQQLISAEVMLK